MIAPLPRHETLSLADEPLPPCWLARTPTRPPPAEDLSAGVYTTGPDGVFRQKLAEGIRGAREVVLVASFLLSDPTIASALLSVGERVRVYVLTASEQRLSGLPREDDLFEARRIEEHKALLDRLAGRAVVRTAGHLHAKFVVVDPRTSPRAWLSTANLNPALVESVELGVELDPSGATSLAGWFARAFWLEAERELADRGRLAEVTAPPSEPARPMPSEVFVTARDERSLGAEAMRIVERSERTLLVCSYGLELDHPVAQALLGRAKAGVPVTVLTRPRPAVSAAANALQVAGASVFAHDTLHAKAIVGDAGALVMTANLERQGLDTGFEVGVRLAPRPAAVLEGALRQWAELFPWRFAARARRGDHVGAILLADKPARDGRREVVAERSQTLSPVTASDALTLAAAPAPHFPAAADGAEIPQRIRYLWSVEPPRLPPGAKELEREVEEEVTKDDGTRATRTARRPYDPPVFDHRGQRFVLLSSPERADAARRLAAELRATVVVR